jgi:tetratricopeptide (TPR) repeat protein
MGQRDRIAKRFKRGDLARSYDLCLEALREDPHDLWLQHRAVLCLIRSGALERAEADYRRFRLSEARHNEDCLALGARLLKAIAFETEVAGFAAKARESAEKYAHVFDQTGGHYPGINAATMYCLSGDMARATDLARQALAASRQARAGDPEAAYYRRATEAEAYLLLGEPGAANLALRAAIASDRENFIAHATTLRQLRIVAAALGVSDSWLASLEPPRPAHFAGHIFRTGTGKGAVSRRRETELRKAVADVLQRENIGSVYGAMAAGADIVIAEVALGAGCPLTVVLPVPVAVFMETSVRPFGAAWVRRYEACLERATDIVEVTTDRQIVSELNLNHASAVAMGLAKIRADVLATRPVQLLAYDGRKTGAARFGTARDAEMWRQTGSPQCVIPFDRPDGTVTCSQQPQPVARSEFEPAMRAMLFLDVRGSSAVPDDRIPCFVREVLGRLAGTCDQLESPPLYADSWGDGLFFAFDDVDQAARAAVT